MAEPRAPEIDARLHRERRAAGGPLISVDRDCFNGLPDGAMVFQGERPFAKLNGELRSWTFQGYGDARDFGELSLHDLWLLTPPTTLEVLRQGYRPVWHPSTGTNTSAADRLG